MTFVSGYRMIFYLFKLEQQIYNSILCNTMVLSSTSSTIIIVPKMIEYGQETPQSQTACKGVPDDKFKVHRGWAWEGDTPSHTTGGKPRNYHEIVLTQICSQATSGTRRGSFQAENWIKKGWFCFILQLRTNNGEIRQCSSV